MVYWMTNLLKATLAGIVFALGYVAYWSIKDRKLPGRKKVASVIKKEPEDYGTPVAPI
tara:strand:+ start:692 stop:865 length:174 start_codon:yes stop_codon:yes gene_type:complete